MIKGVKFASIPVTNQNRALAFFTEKLGIPGADTRIVLQGVCHRCATIRGDSPWGAQTSKETDRRLANSMFVQDHQSLLASHESPIATH